jgi:DNA-binding CsgD family transcriptional regulator
METWSRALRSRLAGRPDPAAWATTVEQLEQVGTVWYTALARTRHAEAAILSGGRADEVAPILLRARETGNALRTPGLLAEIDRLARAAGIELDGAPVAGAAGDGHDVPGHDVPGRDPFGLSPRELEVLALVAAGRTNREIGESLFISPKTASVHVTHILDKLGVSSRVEAALAASRAGIGVDREAGALG